MRLQSDQIEDNHFYILCACETKQMTIYDILEFMGTDWDKVSSYKLLYGYGPTIADLIDSHFVIEKRIKKNEIDVNKATAYQITRSGIEAINKYVADHGKERATSRYEPPSKRVAKNPELQEEVFDFLSRRNGYTSFGLIKKALNEKGIIYYGDYDLKYNLRYLIKDGKIMKRERSRGEDAIYRLI